MTDAALAARIGHDFRSPALLERALTLAEQDEWYQALRLVRHVIRHESAVLGLDPTSGAVLATAMPAAAE